MTPDDFVALQNQVAELAGLVAAGVASESKVSTSIIEVLEHISKLRMLLHVNHLAIGAMAARHPEKEEVLKIFQKMWEIGRGPLGIDNVTDETRAAVQQEVSEIAKALGGRVF